MIKTLSQILDENRWNCPTGQKYGTDKNTTHDYIDGFYDIEFPKYRNKKINILEIGSCFGASLHLWQKYFPNAKITGIDIEDLLQDEHRDIERVIHLEGNAYDEENVSTLDEYDIIIDDGPHTLESQIKCIELYLPKLKKGGILIIEDVQDTSWFVDLQNAVPEEYEDNTECVDLTKNKGRYDDLIFVIRK